MVVSILIVFLLAGIGSAQILEQHAPVKPLTVCEVLSHPSIYDGRVVRIKGRVGSSDEGSWLVDESCPAMVVTDEHTWPRQIAIEMPDIRPQLRVHSPDFQFDRGSDLRITAKYWQLRQTVPDRCVSWTYTGLFETRGDWSKAKIAYRNGSSRFIGFGHNGESPAQLLLKSKDDVTPIPKCNSKVSDR